MDYLLSGKYQIDFGSATSQGSQGRTDDHGVFFCPQGRLFALGSGCATDIYGFTPAELCVDAVRAYLDYVGESDPIPSILHGCLSFANYILRASGRATAVSTLSLAFIDGERRLFHSGSGGLWLRRKSNLLPLVPTSSIPTPLGLGWVVGAKAGVRPLPLLEEDKLLLGTESLFRALDEATLFKLLGPGGDAQQIADRLVRAAAKAAVEAGLPDTGLPNAGSRDAGLRDAITAQVVMLGSAE